MFQSPNRTAFSTSVPTIARADAFTEASYLADEWLLKQTDEFDLSAPTGNAYQEGNGTANLWLRREDDSLAFAFSHRDQHDPAIQWHVLVGVNKADTGANVDVEVAAEGTGQTIPPLGVPGFMPRIVDHVGVVDVWELSTTPQRVTVENARDFISLLQDQKRTLPIVAFSQPLPLTDDDVARIARRVAGAAHIVIVDVAASFMISDVLGKQFSVYQGAVRVYPPKLPRNPYDIKLYFPATIQRYNEQGAPNGVFGTIRFADVLVRSTLDRRMWPAVPAETSHKVETQSAETVSEQTATTALPASARIIERPEEPRLAVSPTLSAIAEEVKKTKRVTEVAPESSSEQSAKRIADLMAQIEELRTQNATLRSQRDSYYDDYFNAQTQLEELQRQADTSKEIAGSGISLEGLTGEDAATMKALFDAFTAIRRMADRTGAAEAATQQLRDENDDQRREIGKLKMMIERLQGRDADEQTRQAERPTDYRDVGAVETYLKRAHGECIALRPNAKKTLAEGLYADSDRIIEMLDLLGKPHHDMKTGVDGAYDAFNTQSDALRVKYSPVLSESSIGEYGDYYRVALKDGSRVEADDIGHIRDLGKSYAPERMAAIYFFWDPDRTRTIAKCRLPALGASLVRM